jgi:hypothetical protein
VPAPQGSPPAHQTVATAGPPGVVLLLLLLIEQTTAAINAAARPLASSLRVVLAPLPTAGGTRGANTFRALLTLLLQMPSQNQIGEYKLIELAGEGSFGKVCCWPGRSLPPPRPPPCPPAFRPPNACLALCLRCLAAPSAACPPLFICLPPTSTTLPACRCGRRGARAACRRWL